MRVTIQIGSATTERLANELAIVTGKSVQTAVDQAIADQLRRKLRKAEEERTRQAATMAAILDRSWARWDSESQRHVGYAAD